jgi:hypothetical protein
MSEREKNTLNFDKIKIKVKIKFSFKFNNFFMKYI